MDTQQGTRTHLARYAHRPINSNIYLFLGLWVRQVFVEQYRCRYSLYYLFHRHSIHDQLISGYCIYLRRRRLFLSFRPSADMQTSCLAMILGTGYQRAKKIWGPLHARTRYKKQQPHFACMLIKLH